MGKDRHVSKNTQGSGWKVTVGGRTTSTHRTQKNADVEAQRSAKKVGADVVVHGRDGKIRSKDTYGKPDPNPPKDTEN